MASLLPTLKTRTMEEIPLRSLESVPVEVAFLTVFGAHERDWTAEAAPCRAF